MSPEPLLILFRSALDISSSPEDVGASAMGLGLAAGAASATAGGSLANAMLVSNREAAKVAKREILVDLIINVITAFLIVVFIFMMKKYCNRTAIEFY
jgi:hypothetical protein